MAAHLPLRLRPRGRIRHRCRLTEPKFTLPPEDFANQAAQSLPLSGLFFLCSAFSILNRLRLAPNGASTCLDSQISRAAFSVGGGFPPIAVLDAARYCCCDSV